MRRFVFGTIGMGLLALAFAPGCNPVKCGAGTRERDGRCVPLSVVQGDGGLHCGLGTVLVADECVPSEDLCGPYTKAVPVFDDAGVPTGFVCKGQGSTEMPTCPDEFGPNGEFCITGQAAYLVDDQGNYMTTPLADANASPDATWVSIKVYDPIEYVQDPTAAVPLGSGQVDPKTGYFRLINVAVPGNPFVAIALDDLDEQAQNLLGQVGTPYDAKGYHNLEGVTAFAITTDQIQDWTTKIGGDAALAQTGCPAPQGGGDRDLLQCGAWVGIYRKGDQSDPGDLVEGVAPVAGISSTKLDPNTTWYLGIDADGNVVFDDPTQGVVWSDDQGPHEWTGMLGAVVHPHAEVLQYSGTCSPDSPCNGCLWRGIQAGSTEGVILTQYMFPLDCP